ncbi:hypothetical protein Ae201684P_012744 [Aphanomyces euteiches]|uniref:DDE Tnp4 domain-containing protein n=1 Tax=Aphanomyces euteiches TaxID=100861 RepID=A0A6G0WC76_9STRA|nr:hypothetical protein Ae201684_016824 [Aphanomyces euteiches]KAH9076256.1 hypothetical protein Ae201684P_012744 [Aphanomyces euteiches]
MVEVYQHIATGIATVLCAVCLSVASVLSTEKYNILTINQVNFDAMLGDPRYNQWFRENLRCDQRSFGRLVVWLRHRMPDQFKRRSRHSFEKKVAVLLFFLGTEGGYRETAAVFGVAKSWCIAIVSSIAATLVKNAKL